MRFEVIGLNGNILSCTEYISRMPSKTELQSMYKAGYKFKMNGKNITKKKLDEFLRENADKLTDDGGSDD